MTFKLQNIYNLTILKYTPNLNPMKTITKVQTSINTTYSTTKKRVTSINPLYYLRNNTECLCSLGNLNKDILQGGVNQAPSIYAEPAFCTLDGMEYICDLQVLLWQLKFLGS